MKSLKELNQEQDKKNKSTQSYRKELAQRKFEFKKDFPNMTKGIETEGYYLVDMTGATLEDFKEVFEMKDYGGRLKKGTMNYAYNSFYLDQGHGYGTFGWKVSKASHSKKFSKLLPKYGAFSNFYAYWGFPRHFGVKALELGSIQLKIELTQSNSRGFYDIRCTISRAWQRDLIKKYPNLEHKGVYSISFRDLQSIIQK